MEYCKLALCFCDRSHAETLCLAAGKLVNALRAIPYLGLITGGDEGNAVQVCEVEHKHACLEVTCRSMKNPPFEPKGSKSTLGL